MKLKEYEKKRDFKKSPEPEAKIARSKKPVFVIQEHHARRLHYDFRLEDKGVLRSWAVPKGLSMDTADKRLAVETEDHPLEYGNFEGTIPKGNYGAGQVIIWDRGTFDNVSQKEGKPISIDAAYRKGHITFRLHGGKVNGIFMLIRTGREKQWLMMKKREEISEKKVAQKISKGEGIGEIWRIKKTEKKKEGSTVKIGGHEISLSNPDKVLFPKSQITKKELVDYYDFIADYMLPYSVERPISMRRFPNGIDGEIFFQKDVPDYFPKWIKTKKIGHEKGVTEYVICSGKASLVYLGTQVTELHTWPSKADNLEFPDKLIFDLDPKEDEYEDVVFGAKMIKELLDELKLESFVMSTGSRGLHVVVPLDSGLDYKKVSSFARVIARSLESNYPKKFTSKFVKMKRQANVFVDTYRNAFSQTSIAPYCARALEFAPISVPLEWNELDSFHPQKYSIRNIRERIEEKGDIWKGKYKPQSLKKALERYK